MKVDIRIRRGDEFWVARLQVEGVQRVPNSSGEVEVEFDLTNWEAFLRRLNWESKEDAG